MARNFQFRVNARNLRRVCGRAGVHRQVFQLVVVSLAVERDAQLAVAGLAGFTRALQLYCSAVAPEGETCAGIIGANHGGAPYGVISFTGETSFKG